MRYRVSPWLLAAALLGSSACGGGSAPGSVLPGEPPSEDDPPAQLALGKPFFIPGESMVFELGLSNVVGGRAVIVTGEPGKMDGRPVVIMRSLVESAGVARWFKTVHDEAQSWLDTETGVPVEQRATFVHGDKHARVATRFAPNGSGVVIEYERNGKPRPPRRQAMPAGEHLIDFHAAMGLLRAWMPRPGDRLYYHTVSSRRVWRTELQCKGSETVRTAMGMHPALRFEGVSVRLNRKLEVDEKKPPRPFTFWLSDDELRMPLRLTARTEYGEFAAELVDYQGPERHLSQR